MALQPPELAHLNRERDKHNAFKRVRRQKDSLFNSGRGLYTDIVIKCRGTEWKAHQIILKTGCEFFRACLEADCVEASSGVIVMDDEDPEACGLFLEFLYSKDLDILHEVWPEDEDINEALAPPLIHSQINIELLVNLCCMADKYHVPSLIEAVADFFDPDPQWPRASHMNELLKMLVGIADFVETPQLFLLKEVLTRNFIRALKNIESIDDKLRLLQQHPEIAVHILSDVPRQMDTEERLQRENNQSSPGSSPGHYFCPYCGKLKIGSFEDSDKASKYCVRCWFFNYEVVAEVEDEAA